MALDCMLTRVQVPDGPMKRVGLGDAAGKLLREALVTSICRESRTALAYAARSRRR